MELCGTVVGVVGLYSVCLQIMEQLDDVRNFDDESGKLRTLFEIEKLIFTRWGNRVGINDEAECHPFLRKDSDQYPLIYRILKQLENEWKRAETFFTTYNAEEPGVTIKSGSAVGSRGKTSIRRKLVWAVKDKKHFRTLLTDVGTIVQKLDNLVLNSSAGSEVRIREMEMSLKALESLLEENISQSEKDRKGAGEFQDKVTTHIDKKDRDRLLRWVGAVSTDYELDDALRGIHTGTCTWIRSTQSFLNWFGPPDVATGASSPVLWFHGGPGIGKTHLSASIIKYLQDHSSSYPTAFFMATHADLKKSQTTSILRSWVCQLIQKEEIALKIAQKVKPKNGDAVPTALWNIFRAIVKGLGPCYLVIDGYDECLDYDPDSRSSSKGALQSFMKELLISTESTEAKILIVSRNLDTIRSGLYEPINESKLRRVTEYPVAKEDTQQDIELVSGEIVESKIQDDSQKKAISDQLKKGCDGMFLWLRLVNEQLELGMPYTDIKDILDSVPDGLEQAYQRNIDGILKTGIKNRQRALDIFQIMLFAIRPLSVTELLCALRMKDAVDRRLQEPPEFIQDSEITHLMIQTLLVKPCCSLIEVRGGSDAPQEKLAHSFIHFVHFSVKEYLLGRMQSEALHRGDPSGKNHDASYIFGPRNGDDILHEVCLSYIFMCVNFEKLGDNQFHGYAKYSWRSHFDRFTGDSRSRGLCFQKRLFEGPWFQKWADNYKKTRKVVPRLEALVNSVLSPAEVAAMLDLPDLSISLFPHGKTPQRVLAYAVAFGKPATIRTLFQSREDFDVNWAADGYPWIPLSAAFNWYRAHSFIVLLGQEGLNLYAPLNDKGDTLLHLLVRSQPEVDLGMVGILLAVFDINCKNISGESPLYVLVSSPLSPSSKEVLRYFVERVDTDLNAPDNHGRSPLHALCNNKSLKYRLAALRVLLSCRGIDINALDIEERTPLDYLQSNTSATPFNAMWGLIRATLVANGAKTGWQLRMIQTASIHSASDYSGTPEDCSTVSTVCATISANSGETNLTPTDEGTRPIDPHLEGPDTRAYESNIRVDGAQAALETNEKSQKSEDARDSAQIAPNYASDVGEPETSPSLAEKPHRTYPPVTQIAEGEVRKSPPVVGSREVVLSAPRFLYFIPPFLVFIVSLYLYL